MSVPAVTVETQIKLAEWRRKAREGTLTVEESREALKFLRADRLSAGTATTKASKSKSIKAQAAAVDTQALKDRFKALL